MNGGKNYGKSNTSYFNRDCNLNFRILGLLYITVPPNYNAASLCLRPIITFATRSIRSRRMNHLDNGRRFKYAVTNCILCKGPNIMCTHKLTHMGSSNLGAYGYRGMEDCGIVMNRVNGGRRKVNSALYHISLLAANYYICNAIRRRIAGG